MDWRLVDRSVAPVPGSIWSGTEDFIPKVPVLECESTSLIFDLPREGDEVQEPQYVRIELANIEESAVDEFIEGLKNGGFAQNVEYSEGINEKMGI